MKIEETKLTFYGNQAFAMLPLVGCILIGGISSVGLHYCSMKDLSFAVAVSFFAGLFLYRKKDRYWDSVVRGLAQHGNSRPIFVSMVIGVFFKLMNTRGTGDGFIWFSFKLGISRSGLMVFSFLVSVMIPTGADAPIVAMLVVIPVFYPPGILLGANPAMLAGVLINGIFFGDTILPGSQVISTMVMIQHDGVTGQPADLSKALRTRTPYTLAADGAVMVIYLISGGRGGAMGDTSQMSVMSSPRRLWILVPLAVPLLVCLRTGNLFMGLSSAIVSGLAVGLPTRVPAPSDIVAIDYGTLGPKGVIFEGISGMPDVMVSTTLLCGLIAVAVDGEVMERCCN